MKLKLTLIGYGKMGKMVERAALMAGHTIVSIIDSKQFNNHINAQTIHEADVCIDFTHPFTVLKNIKQVASLGKNMVVGTTGWEKEISAIKDLVMKNNIGFLYGPNFSIGINLFIKCIQNAAKTFSPYNQYAIGGWEAHHHEKADAPSGTAKALINALSENTNQPRETIPFSSLRCGSFPGTHTIVFDSPHDTLTFSHVARNREGFAEGALLAAEWVVKNKGFYTFSDLFKDYP